MASPSASGESVPAGHPAPPAELAKRAKAAKFRHRAAKARLKAERLRKRAAQLEVRAAAWGKRADDLDGVVGPSSQVPPPPTG